MVMIDGMNNEQACKSYVANQLKEYIGDDDKRLVFWGHKNRLVVKDPDIFHVIAKMNLVDEINLREGVLDYIIDVPHENHEDLPDHWTVELHEGLLTEFLSYYKVNYTINKK